MIKPVSWTCQLGKNDAEMHYPDDSSRVTRNYLSPCPSPTVPGRTPGVAVWLHNHMAEDVAAYRPSPLAHYGQLKGLPKIIPLFQP